MYIDKEHPVSKIIRFAGVANSTWYSYLKKKESDERCNNKGRPFPGYTKNPNGTMVSDSSIVNILRTYRDRVEFKNAGGCSKLKHYIRRDYKLYINHKKIYRLCKENKLLLPKIKKIRRLGEKICMNRKITAPNQLWQFDIKYGYIHGENRFFYILAFIDIFHREIVDYHLGLSCKSGDLKFTLQNALAKKNISKEHNLVIRSDNGTQMTSFMFQEYIQKLSILEHEFIPPATPNKNAHVESFFSIVETEFLQTKYFSSYAQAYKEAVEFIRYYNNDRIHGSLYNKTPFEIAESYKKGEVLRIKNLRA